MELIVVLQAAVKTLKKLNKNPAKRIKELEAHLMNINDCVARLANNKDLKDSRKLLANLEEYIKKALKG